jgi:uncharacterized protein (DUF952 family)
MASQSEARRKPRKSVLIFKIVRAAEWQTAERVGTYDGSEYDKADGFLHFSTAPQLRETLEKHYAQEPGTLVIAAFDDAQFGEALKWEVSRNGEPFPHLYGPLPLNEVAATLAPYRLRDDPDYKGLNFFLDELAKPVEAQIGASGRDS